MKPFAAIKMMKLKGKCIKDTRQQVSEPRGIQPEKCGQGHVLGNDHANIIVKK